MTQLKQLLGPEAATLAALALKFCLHHPAVITVIPGMRSVEHVEGNLSVADQSPLSGEMISQLRGHCWDKNFYSPA